MTMRKNHRLFKIVVLAFSIASMALGQSNNFEFMQHDSAYVGNDELIILDAEIYSNISSSQSITVTRVTHEMPATWTSSFCVGPACLPPFLDSYTFDLQGYEAVNFTNDTYPNGELGFGNWTFYAVDSSTMEVDSIALTLEYVTVGLDRSFERPGSFELSPLFPNPTNASINFDLFLERAGEYSIILYALNGQEMMTRSYGLQSGKNHIRWNMQGLPSGNYILSATGMGETISRKLSVIK